MTRLVLGNSDYRKHMTNEGLHLQEGLVQAGWQIVGQGYGSNLTDVGAILDRYVPDIVFVQDKRDWDPRKGAFDLTVGFQRLELLAQYRDVVKTAVVKDAGTAVDYQRSFCQEIDAQAVVVYYHPQSVLAVSPWLRRFPLIRTYHTVDIEGPFPEKSRRCVVSGALSDVYPVRQLAFRYARKLGLEILPHPGYHNKGCQTHIYVEQLSRFKVHVATASKYGFALRKIIESVACGATPVTDLPGYDVLPEIDGALVRISKGARIEELLEGIRRAEREWDLDKARYWADRARAFYHWKAVGQRLSADLQAVAPRPSLVTEPAHWGKGKARVAWTSTG